MVLFDTAGALDEAFDVSFLELNDHPVVVCHGLAPDATCTLLGCDGWRPSGGVKVDGRRFLQRATKSRR
jgi:hypothetical protein